MDSTDPEGAPSPGEATLIGVAPIPEQARTVDGRRAPVAIHKRDATGELIISTGKIDPDWPTRGRTDLDSYAPGELYLHSGTGKRVRYLGAARMPELFGERVGICEVVGEDLACLLLDLSGFSRGEVLKRIEGG